MSEELSRQALFDLVWATPVRALAKRFSVSDPTLRKACQRARVPLPQAGYWAKVAAGKKVSRPSLPKRPFGLHDTITPGAGRYQSSYRRWTDTELLGPVPPAPSFTPDIDEVRKICRDTIDKIIVRRDLDRAHHAIGKLLAIDEERRISQIGKAYVSPWDAPRFTTAFEQRRLRILNALMLALGRAGVTVKLSGKNARGIHLTVHDEMFWMRLDDEAGVLKHPEEHYPTKTLPGTPLHLAILPGYGSAPIVRWSDDTNGKLEAHLRDAVAEIIVQAEASYRASCEGQHQWRIERKAQRIEEIETARRAAEQAERDRIERLKQERMARLLGEAEAFRKAETIRGYVASVRERRSDIDAEAIAKWARWALDIAASIDPVRSGSFLLEQANDT